MHAKFYLHNMSKTITVKVDEDIEKTFREAASRRYGKRKGYLGKAITEAMKEWSEKGEKSEESKFRELLEKGVKMKKWKFNREELHDR